MTDLPKLTRVLPAKQRDDLYRVLEAAGWRREGGPGVDLPTATVPVASVWSAPPPLQAQAAWFDDDLLRHFYGIVWGIDRDAAAQALRDTGWMIDGAGAIRAIQHASRVDQLCSTALALGLLAQGPFDGDVHKVLVGLLHSANVDLQFDAVAAIGLSAWPQFEAELAALAADPAIDPELRDEAQTVLSDQRASNWNAWLR